MELLFTEGFYKWGRELPSVNTLLRVKGEPPSPSTFDTIT